ncbi:MAG: glycyl-radical enzyme activating protein [bacterium]
MSNSEEQPLIFDIHRFAIDDGPGIRTTVFLKGCTLGCVWCQNPESIESGPEIAFYRNLCIGGVCDDCLKVCPRGAISPENAERINSDKCGKCGKCVDICPSTALKTIGKYYSVPEITEVLLGDAFFYKTSRGGVTFSGGEPTLYMDYLERIMKALKEKDIHIAIQTCGVFGISEFKERLLKYIDLIFYDIKLFDPGLHKRYTGRDNKIILENFIDLIKEPGINIIPRVPLVPEITATRKNLLEIARFLRDVGCTSCFLLPYNPGGIAKGISIRRPVHPEVSKEMMGFEEEESLKKFFHNELTGQGPPY